MKLAVPTIVKDHPIATSIGVVVVFVAVYLLSSSSSSSGTGTTVGGTDVNDAMVQAQYNLAGQQQQLTAQLQSQNAQLSGQYSMAQLQAQTTLQLQTSAIQGEKDIEAQQYSAQAAAQTSAQNYNTTLAALVGGFNLQALTQQLANSLAINQSNNTTAIKISNINADVQKTISNNQVQQAGWVATEQAKAAESGAMWGAVSGIIQGGEKAAMFI
jgi:hypothetical protein